MIDLIIDNKVEWIESDLISRGLKYESLREDILDHICCLLEESMIEGKDFETSYSEIIENIGDDRLRGIEHQTLLLLDKNFQKMKKTTYIIGLVSALVMLFGSLSKRMHWPGAGMELTLGLLGIIFVFLPLYFIVNYRERGENKNIVYPIVGYFTLALILTGAIFRIQHWPGANFVFWAGLAVLIIGFVPLYLVNAFKKSEGEKVGLPYIVMLLVGIGIASLTINVSMAKNVLDDYKEEIIRNEQRIKDVEYGNLELIQLARDNSQENIELIEEIHRQANELQNMIDEMIEEMLVSIKEPGISVSDLRKGDKKGVGRDVIVDNGWARRFMEKSRAYRELLSEIVKDPVVRAQIADHLEYVTKVWYNEWGYREVIYDPVIKIYYKHSDVALGIGLSENAAINYLMVDN
jgi:hypothetical protein